MYVQCKDYTRNAKLCLETSKQCAMVHCNKGNTQNPEHALD